MCTARSGRPRNPSPRAAAARSSPGESGPPLHPTTSPLTSAGTEASSAACKAAGILTAPSSRLLTLAERAEVAQARLAGIEQLCNRLIAQFRQVFDDALFHRFGHQLRIPLRPAMRFLEHFIDQLELEKPFRRAAHRLGRDFLFFRALP